MTLFRVLDALSLWSLWYCSAVFLIGGHAVQRVRELVIALSLIAIMSFSFAGVVAIAALPHEPSWWGLGMRGGAALLAWALYDYRFGIVRHLRMAWHGLVWLPRAAQEFVRYFKPGART